MVISSKIKNKWGYYQKFKKEIADDILKIFKEVKNADSDIKKLISGSEFLIRNSFNKKEFDSFGEKYYPKYVCLFIISGVLVDISPTMYISQRKRTPVYQISIFCKDEAFTGFIHSVLCECIVDYYRNIKKMNVVMTDLSHNEYVEAHQSYCAKVNVKFSLNF